MESLNLRSLKNRYGIVGKDERFNAVLEASLRIAPTDLSVLIYGQSGVGKEVFSKIIHDNSPRKHKPFLAINCGALPEGTINAELFGHEKGSFTGASESRKGYFETVNGGTLFLDEIGEMPLVTQAYLLRVLESGEYIKVGSSEVRTTDTRIIAATNQDLSILVAQRKFREDLFYRLNTVTLSIPSLSQRKGDIPLLFQKFAIDFSEKYATDPIILDVEAEEVLVNLPFRGNIRELKNLAERVSVLAKDKKVSREVFLSLLEPTSIDRSLPPALTSDAVDTANTAMLYNWVLGLKAELAELKKILFEILPQWSQHPPLYKGTSTTDEKEIPPFVKQLPEPNYELAHLSENIGNENLSLLAHEKATIEKALHKHKGKRKKAAAELEISARTLYRKIKDYDIHLPKKNP